MVAPLGIAGITLAERRAAEFAPPEHERVVEQAAVLEIMDQGGRRGVGVGALDLQLREQVAVLIPAGVHQLHEPRAPLEQPPRDQAVVGEASLRVDVGPVAVDHVLRLVGKIDQVGYARLHPVGHFVLCDPRLDLGVAEVGEVPGVHGGDVVEQRPSGLTAHAGGIGEVGHRVAGVAELHPLEAARQEAAAPVVVEEELSAALLLVARRHDDERWQVVGLAAEPVAHPGPHARPARHLRARQEKRHAGGVVHRLRVHASDDAEVVGQAAEIRQHLAHFDAALAVLSERLDRRHGGPLGITARHRRKPRRSADAVGDVLTSPLLEHRLGIEEVDVRRPAPLPEHHHSLRLRLVVRQPRQARLAPRCGRRRGRSKRVALEQRGEGHRADPEAGRAEQVAAVKKVPATKFG